MISLLAGCAGIPVNKVRILDYPEIRKEGIKNLDISYEHFESTEGNKSVDVASKFEKIGIKKVSEKINSKCLVESRMDIGAYSFWGCPIFTNILSIPTLTIIPYYCQIGIEARANLIFYPEESEIYGNIIKPSLNQAKLGEIFLDENNRPAKLLKTYELKDKVHEVWSLIWMLSWLAVEPNKYSSIQNKYLEVGRHPEVAKTETENNISEALTRSIINDAIDHPECYKNSDPKHVLKVQSDVKKYQKNYK